MYTHIYIRTGDAEMLFSTYSNKPLGPGEFGVVTRPTFASHFDQYLQTYLQLIGANLEIVRVENLFVLKFDHYLTEMPWRLVEMGIKPIRVEIRRFSSAPTKARAGHYRDHASGFSAIVERVFPQQQDQFRKPAPLYAQNITVSGPTLERAQRYNSMLSQGSFSRFLVNAFE